MTNCDLWLKITRRRFAHLRDGRALRNARTSVDCVWRELDGGVEVAVSFRVMMMAVLEGPAAGT